MPSQFYVWIDDNKVGNSTISANDFQTDTQRSNGFISGKAASALRVNSALRQSNLVAVALINALIESNPDTNDGLNEVNLRSSVDAVKTAFTNTNLFKLSSLFDVTANGNTLKSTITPNDDNVSLGLTNKRFANAYFKAVDVQSIKQNNVNTFGNIARPIYINDGTIYQTFFTILVDGNSNQAVTLNFITI